MLYFCWSHLPPGVHENFEVRVSVSFAAQNYVRICGAAVLTTGNASRVSAALPRSLEDAGWVPPHSHSGWSLMALLSSAYYCPVVLRGKGGSERLCDLPKGSKVESVRSRAASMRRPPGPHSGSTDLRVWCWCGGSDRPLGAYSPVGWWGLLLSPLLVGKLRLGGLCHLYVAELARPSRSL